MLALRSALAALILLGRATSAPVADPPARAHHALVYDAAHKRVLLVGGSTPLDNGSRFQFFNDTWAFDGVHWQLVGNSGSGRSGQRLAWDGTTNTVFSFGGYSGQSMSDLQRLDNGAWTKVNELPDRPTAEGGLAYDTKRKRLVLFGGSAGRGLPQGDTREFDGTSWQTVRGTGPDARQAFAMVYDEKRGRTIVFGGGSADGSRQFSDTWEYDGKAWTRIDVTGPTARVAPGAAYDTKRGVMIIFGGVTSAGFVGDTWSWDGQRWQQLSTTGPDARGMGELAYDQGRDRVVLFGGRKGYPNGDLNDTWEWDGNTWTRVRS